MSEPIPTVLPRDCEVATKAAPLFDDARVVSARAIDDLRAVEAELQELIDRAQTAVEEAEERAESIREQARTQGRNEAMEECMEHLAAARSEYTVLRQRAEQDMVTLAFRIARRLIGRTIELDPEVVRDIVGTALVKARGREEIVVCVHPEDLRYIEQWRDEYTRSLDGVPVYFDSDPELERGDAVIETESGRIDARLESQLEVLRNAVMDAELIDHDGRSGRRSTEGE